MERTTPAGRWPPGEDCDASLGPTPSTLPWSPTYVEIPRGAPECGATPRTLLHHGTTATCRTVKQVGMSVAPAESPVCPSKLIQTLPNSSKLFQTLPNPSKLIQTLPNSTKLIQTLPNSSKLFQTHPSSSKLIQTHPNSSKPIQTRPKQHAFAVFVTVPVKRALDQCLIRFLFDFFLKSFYLFR